MDMNEENPDGTQENVVPEVTKIPVVELCGKGHEKVNGKCPTCGRPPEYTTDEEMVAKVDEFLNNKQDQERSDGKLNVHLPTLDGFSQMLGIHVDTLQEWRKLHSEFSVACRKIEVEQKERLIDKGLANQYNPVIAKLILSSNHGMRERVDSDVTSKGERVDGLAVSFIKPKE